MWFRSIEIKNLLFYNCFKQSRIDFNKNFLFFLFKKTGNGKRKEDSGICDQISGE